MDINDPAVEQALKNIDRTILEWNAIILCSNHCFSCLQHKPGDNTMTLLKVDNDEVLNCDYIAVPVCKECVEEVKKEKITSKELYDSTLEAMDKVPFTVITKDGK